MVVKFETSLLRNQYSSPTYDRSPHAYPACNLSGWERLKQALGKTTNTGVLFLRPGTRDNNMAFNSVRLVHESCLIYLDQFRAFESLFITQIFILT